MDNNLVGQVLLRRYRVKALIGRGAMAEVYLAYDAHRCCDVALKIMREDLIEDNEFISRFRDEARVLSQLNHPSIVRFYEFEQTGPVAFLVMDYIAGITLQRQIRTVHGPLPLPGVRSVVDQVCTALIYAHHQNIIHRDVKPGNIMLSTDGRALLSDFGIAKVSDGATVTTLMPGTPAYMSPEQMRDAPLDHRADIYSLGIVLYEMLAGRRPFDGAASPGTTGSTSRDRLRWDHLNTPPPDPRKFNPALSPALADVILRAVAKDPRERWQNVEGLLGAFDAACASVQPVPFTVAGPTQTQTGPDPTHPNVGPVTPLPPLRTPPPPGRTTNQRALGIGVVVAAAAFVLLAIIGISALTSMPTSTKKPSATITPAAAGLTYSDGMVGDPVPEGNFNMGSADTDLQAAKNEKPQHPVHLYAFWIDQTEVTRGMYDKCVAESVCRQPIIPSGDNYPVVGVSWNDAKTYCEWAGRRLPTEAEWEKAARGTDGRLYPWGNEPPKCTYANFWAKEPKGCMGGITAVGSYPNGASPYGALDMAGNAWEWVNDLYTENYGVKPPALKPTGTVVSNRVLRGGGWNSSASAIRAVFRGSDSDVQQTNSYGFRCAR